MIRLKVIGVLTVGAVLVTAGTASGAGLQSHQTKLTGSTLTVPTIEAFSGASAMYGPSNLAGCIAGVDAVNAEGGVLGHPLACKAVNDTGDPADAVPAVDQMLTNTSNIVFTIGPGTTAPAVTPILTAAKIVEFSVAGSASYDHNTDPYFYRTTASDSVTGVAMAYWAIKHGYKTAVSVLTNVSAVTIASPLATEFKKLGGRLIKQLIVSPDQSSYRTEASDLVSAHAQVVFTETDAQTAATFWSEVVQQTKKIPPVIGDESDTYSTYVNAVLPVVGKTFNLVCVTQANPAPNAGLRDYQKELLTTGSQIKNPSQYLTSSFTYSDYDAVIVGALAMVAAKSTNPTVFQKYISAVTGVVNPGDVVVHTFAQGAAALSSGKKIRYSGAGGLVIFNKYHNVAVPFGGVKLNDSSKKFTSVGQLPPGAVA